MLLVPMMKYYVGSVVFENEHQLRNHLNELQGQFYRNLYNP
jgi:hypothetical protein